jgi:hypothetical protein
MFEVLVAWDLIPYEFIPAGCTVNKILNHLGDSEIKKCSETLQ